MIVTLEHFPIRDEKITGKKNKSRPTGARIRWLRERTVTYFTVSDDSCCFSWQPNVMIPVSWLVYVISPCCAERAALASARDRLCATEGRGGADYPSRGVETGARYSR